MNEFVRKQSKATQVQEAVEKAIDDYIGGKRYPGRSSFENKDTLKEIARRNNGSAVWDKEEKCWCASNVHVLGAFIQSGIWWPEGMSSEWKHVLEAKVDRAIKASPSVAAAQKIQDEHERERQKAIDAAREKREDQKKRMLDAKKDDDFLLEDLAVYGVTSEIVGASAEWAELGPRSGISNAERILRVVKIATVSLRMGMHHGEELDRVAESVKKRKLADIVQRFNDERLQRTNNDHPKKELKNSGGKPKAAKGDTSKALSRHQTQSPGNDAVHQTPVDTGGRPEPAKSQQKRVYKARKYPVCKRCKSTTIDQFKECGCPDSGTWTLCKTCDVLVHPTLSPCNHTASK